MKKFRNIIFVILTIVMLIPFNVKADEKIKIYLFYGDTCPHCAEEEKFFNEYLEDKENVELVMYEIWNNKDNQKLLSKVQKKLDKKANGVPYLVIGNSVIVGYSEGITDVRIKKYVEDYISNGNFVDYVEKIINNEKIEELIPTEEKIEEIKVPILGKINAKNVSLPLLAVVLGLADGFNPCAMWILIFLITMLLNMKNRKRMWILGLTFITTSGVVYLAFMLTWLNLATFISKISFVRLLIAFISFFVGYINLNNYFKAKKKDDGCEVVDKKERKKIMTKIMDITSEKKFVIALLSIIVLAISVNVIEMMCSIGLPLVFTQILAMNNLGFGSYMLYMFIYILFFLIDDIAVFVIAMTTLKVTGISTKYSKYSHLIAGIITLIIGLLLLLKPSILMFNF